MKLHIKTLLVCMLEENNTQDIFLISTIAVKIQILTSCNPMYLIYFSSKVERKSYMESIIFESSNVLDDFVKDVNLKGREVCIYMVLIHIF